MITIWGRANSVNVQKVLWCCCELDIEFERIDAGLHFGRNTEADFLAMNPNGRVPTLTDGTFSLWESNSIMRYLALQYGAGNPIYPSAPQQRASVERWLDWSLSTLQPAERPMFWGLVRTPLAERNMRQLQIDTDTVAKLWHILDQHLCGRFYMESDVFTLADIVLGAYARRWFGVEGVEKPALPDLERWYASLQQRPGFHLYISPPLS